MPIAQYVLKRRRAQREGKTFSKQIDAANANNQLPERFTLTQGEKEYSAIKDGEKIVGFRNVPESEQREREERIAIQNNRARLNVIDRRDVIAENIKLKRAFPVATYGTPVNQGAIQIQAEQPVQRQEEKPVDKVGKFSDIPRYAGGLAYDFVVEPAIGVTTAFRRAQKRSIEARGMNISKAPDWVKRFVDVPDKITREEESTIMVTPLLATGGFTPKLAAKAGVLLRGAFIASEALSDRPYLEKVTRIGTGLAAPKIIEKAADVFSAETTSSLLSSKKAMIGGRTAKVRSGRITKAEMRKASFGLQRNPNVFKDSGEVGIRFRSPELKNEFTKQQVIRYGLEESTGKIKVVNIKDELIGATTFKSEPIYQQRWSLNNKAGTLENKVNSWKSQNILKKPAQTIEIRGKTLNTRIDGISYQGKPTPLSQGKLYPKNYQRLSSQRLSSPKSDLLKNEVVFVSIERGSQKPRDWTSAISKLQRPKYSKSSAKQIIKLLPNAPAISKLQRPKYSKSSAKQIIKLPNAPQEVTTEIKSVIINKLSAPKPSYNKKYLSGEYNLPNARGKIARAKDVIFDNNVNPEFEYIPSESINQAGFRKGMKEKLFSRINKGREGTIKPSSPKVFGEKGKFSPDSIFKVIPAKVSTLNFNQEFSGKFKSDTIIRPRLSFNNENKSDVKSRVLLGVKVAQSFKSAQAYQPKLISSQITAQKFKTPNVFDTSSVFGKTSSRVSKPKKPSIPYKPLVPDFSFKPPYKPKRPKPEPEPYEIVPPPSFLPKYKIKGRKVNDVFKFDRKYKYNPSIVGLELGVRSSKAFKKKEFSGFELRGL